MPPINTHAAPRPYDKPYVGQVFKRPQNDTHVEYGYCSGLKDTGPTTWTATIESGIAQTYRIYNGAVYGTGDWTPLTAKEVEELRGVAVLGDVVTKAQFLALEKRCADAEQAWRALEEHVHAQDKKLAALDERVGTLKDALVAFNENRKEDAAAGTAPTNGAPRASRTAVIQPRP